MKSIYLDRILIYFYDLRGFVSEKTPIEYCTSEILKLKGVVGLTVLCDQKYNLKAVELKILKAYKSEFKRAIVDLEDQFESKMYEQ